MGSILGDHIIRHSMSRKWPILNSQSTQFLSESQTLVLTGRASFSFRFDSVFCSIYKRNLSYPRLSRTDFKILPLIVMLAHLHQMAKNFFWVSPFECPSPELLFLAPMELRLCRLSQTWNCRFKQTPVGDGALSL